MTLSKNNLSAHLMHNNVTDYRTPNTSRRLVARAVMTAMLAQMIPLPALAGQLTVADGVTVKFGQDAQLVVRDQLTTGKGIVLTSQKDDSAGGASGATAQKGAPGDWRGVRLETSAASYGTVTLSDLVLRFGGAADIDGAGAALTVRALNSVMQNLDFSDNLVGLRLLDVSNATLQGTSFMRNGTGMDVDKSAPTVSGSQFVGNTAFAINNKTPATTVLATNNWWGNASGPREAGANPQGQGDKVSTGVNFASYLAGQPLLNPTLRMAVPAIYVEQHAVALELSCLNATEYRLAEKGAFANVAFAPLTNGRGQVTFTTSDGDGNKGIEVQYRNAGGAIVSASLAGGVLVDTLAPVVSISSPAAGSVLAQPVSIQASATDLGGIANVQFFIDGVLAATSVNAPYSYAWNLDGSPDGAHTIKAVATDLAGRSAESSSAITVKRSAVVPDTAGPDLANISFNGAALANGAVLTRSAALTLSASDRSGIARIDLLLDGAVIGTASGSATYTVMLDLANVANGAHTLALRATDSLNNVSTSSYTVTVNHAAPAAPALTPPAGGSTTREALFSVSGNAVPGGTVQLILNGKNAGATIVSGSAGQFSGSLTLAPGVNEIKATVTDQYGTSAASAPLAVTLDATVPSSPGNLTALAQLAGKVHLGWTRSVDQNTIGYHVYRAAAPFDSISQAVKVSSAPLNAVQFDDLPPQDGTWSYRVVALNQAGTPSLPSNPVQARSDSTAPKAVSIVYTPLGKTDAASGRVGQGKVNVVLTVSELLESAPYLSLIVQGTPPMPVELSKGASNTYTGSFVIDQKTGSGTANALFSARDAVGNRGTEIDAGATLAIDTAGPALSGIVLNPASPIKNENGATVNVSLTFSEAPASMPQVKFSLSGSSGNPSALSGLAKVNPTTYSGTLTLPANAGMAGPEALSFSVLAQDELGNVSTRVSAFNRFQVYKGDLPPLNVPFGFTALAQPGGKVKLSWQAVEEASSYQLYRQAPGQQSLTVLKRTSGIDYIDQASPDGLYKYAVETVRASNGQESLSGQSAAQEVTSRANAPGAPQSLMLKLAGPGVAASWQAPLSSSVAYYNLYRAGGTSIGSIAGLTPLKSRITTLLTYDSNPSPTQGAYVVTAVDAAGNESAMSNSGYLNASLFPVRQLRVEQIDNNLPVVSWSAPNGSVAGYLVYAGPDSARFKLTPTVSGATSLTDTGYSAGERRYTVVSVDANNAEQPRSIVLPSVSTAIVSGLPIKRGMMNRLQAQVVNTSASKLDNVRVVVRLPIDKEGKQFKDHQSDPFPLGANQTRLVSVIVGGYADLGGAPLAQVGVEIAQDEDSLVKVARSQTLSVSEGSLVVGISTDGFTRGGTGKVKLNIENTGDVDVELLTATAGGAKESTELRFKILDGDGNVLATQAYKQVIGPDVISLANGQTVARIAAGANYVSDVFEVNVPASSPNAIRVRLEVDKLRYHSGEADEVQVGGRGSERVVSLLDTAYYVELSSVTPTHSFGDQKIVMSGRALERVTNVPMPNTRVKLVLNQEGFERTLSVLTNSKGEFDYAFEPTVSDAGLYKVSAVHPSITDRPEQKQFTINRVTVGPNPYALDIPKNLAFSIPFVAKSGPGTEAKGLRLTLDAATQPTGQIPAGISAQMAPAMNMTERQTLNVPVVFKASNEAQPSGTLIFSVVSDAEQGKPMGQVKVNYTLSEAKPYLVSAPTMLETGLSQGATQIETVTFKNAGLEDTEDLQFTLTKEDGSAVPAWASIASQSGGKLAIGASRAVDLSFAPPQGTQAERHVFKLNVAAANLQPQWTWVYVHLTQSGKGNVHFKVADIYTKFPDKDGKIPEGLANATITMTNEDVPSVTSELVTNVLGEADFVDLPAGTYKFRARAANHQEVGGRLLIKPGVKATQPVFLNYNLVTVEWSVREIAIQDRYEITLNQTFETNVPAAVVVLQPAGINLPKMAPGDVYYGELTLTNYGLYRADNVQQRLPTNDRYFRYEFLVDVPPALEAKQRVSLPFRVIALESLDGAVSTGVASGGGCAGYSNGYGVVCEYICANGAKTTCGARTAIVSPPAMSCPGSGGGIGGGGGGSGGYGGSSSPPPKAKPIKGPKGKKCVKVPEGGKAAPQMCS
ncbi:Ig-like domain-containing protein [Massilia genomosp. 1]|uniref:Fibronectin type-III domain-containing protein n=1 Tax=Massilia genomosp. 1 TaxID=2609280 RepID=A0ABX0MTY5_9BURK|nr:Ig-like domain-containing protein [Massilia genomosp. 1]NHZ66195.1 hypothetical protein [Massilia genomosp. 1]